MVIEIKLHDLSLAVKKGTVEVGHVPGKISTTYMFDIHPGTILCRVNGS